VSRSPLRAYDADYRVHLTWPHAPTYARCDHFHEQPLRLFAVATDNPLTCLWCVVIDLEELRT